MPVTDNPAQNLTFASNGREAHGYLALPPAGTGPGLIVIQEWWGLTSHIVDVSDRLAAEGYVVLAPDLFGGVTTHDSGEAAELMRALPVEQAARDLAGAVDYLLRHDAVTSERLGVVGFCMGGGFVLTLAAQQGSRIAAAVPFYGVLQGAPDFSGMDAEVLGHYGEQDDTIPAEQARALAERIHAESGRPAEFLFYPAGHAFFNDENLLGTYDEESARTAWVRTLEFLRTRLG
jgi:carboxymethylenebutenolidase